MRALLGFLVLFLLFGLAGAVHSRWRDGVHREREALLARRAAHQATDEELWGRARLVLGRPSGALALELPQPLAPIAPPAAGHVEDSGIARDGEGAPSDWRPPVYEMTVRPGQVLSVICQDFYGSGRPPIPQIVAEYNGLADADSVRAGQTLYLPPLDLMGAAER